MDLFVNPGSEASETRRRLGQVLDYAYRGPIATTRLVREMDSAVCDDEWDCASTVDVRPGLADDSALRHQPNSIGHQAPGFACKASREYPPQFAAPMTLRNL